MSKEKRGSPSRSPSNHSSPRGRKSPSGSPSPPPRRRRIVYYDDSEDSREHQRSPSQEREFSSGDEDYEDSHQRAPPRQKIPRKSDYATAVDELPDPPTTVVKKKRTRIRLDSPAKERLENFARGIFLPHTERTALLQDLPLAASDFALPPVIDEEIQRIVKRNAKGGTKPVMQATVSSLDLSAMHEIALTTIQLLEVIRKAGADGKNAAQYPEQVTGYFEIIQQLNSALIKDVVGLQRAAILRSVDLPPATVMPSFKTAIIDGKTVYHELSGEMRPLLFGKSLHDEASDGGGGFQKLVDAYAKRPQGPSRGDGRKTADKFTSGHRGKRHKDQSRLFRSRMVAPCVLRFSAICADQPDAEEGERRSVSNDSDYSLVGIPGVVSDGSRDGVRRETDTKGSEPFDRPSGRGTSAITSEEFQLTSVEDLPRLWRSKGYNQEVAQTILDSWAPSTRRQYNSALSKWREFINTSVVNFVPTAASLCAFLLHLHKIKRSYSSVASHKAALATIFDMVYNLKLAEDPMVVRLMKGIFRKNPPAPRYAATWNVDHVLDYVVSLGENEAMSQKQLSHKLVFLLSICCPRRVSEIAALSLDAVQKSADRWTFFLDYRNKTRSRGAPQQVVYETHSENALLCPLRTLGEYLNRTNGWRKDDSKLLRSYCTKKPISSATVARWIRTVLMQAGISDQFKAHSTRSASTSKALTSGASIKEIFAAASWSDRSGTFNKYYKRESTSFQTHVLSRKPGNVTSVSSSSRTPMKERLRHPPGRSHGNRNGGGGR